MKKLLSVILTLAMLTSLVAVSAFSTSAQSVDIADISKAIENIELSFSIEDKIASLRARTYKVSEEPQVPYTEIDGYAYGYIGDVDGDDDVTIFDATAIQMDIAQLEPLMATLQLLADIDANGEISIMDVTEIQLYAAQLSDSQRIFHMLYSPFENFDPMLDTFDDIANYLLEEGTPEYVTENEDYQLKGTIEDSGITADLMVSYCPAENSVSFSSSSYFDGVSIDSVVTFFRGSQTFDYVVYMYGSPDYVYTSGTGTLAEITENGEVAFNLTADYLDCTFELSNEDLYMIIAQPCWMNISGGEYLLQDAIVGSVLDLAYDITKLYEFV